MRSIRNKILFILAIAFLVLQLYGPDRSVPDTDISKDFRRVTEAPRAVSNLLLTACYDCHSYKTEYPWYTSIEPLSWWIDEHIKEGREELNFSIWADYTTRKKDHKLEEAIEKIQEGEMPLPSYTWIHWSARLSDEEKTLLTDWFSSLR